MGNLVNGCYLLLLLQWFPNCAHRGTTGYPLVVPPTGSPGHCQFGSHEIYRDHYKRSRDHCSTTSMLLSNKNPFSNLLAEIHFCIFIDELHTREKQGDRSITFWRAAHSLKTKKLRSTAYNLSGQNYPFYLKLLVIHHPVANKIWHCSPWHVSI